MKFIAEGNKLIKELLRSNFSIEGIYATVDWIRVNSSHINKDIPIITITDKELVRISSLKTPNHVLAVVKIQEHAVGFPDFKKNLVLMLDNISDPGNMGTIIRTADWFGIKHIICSEDCVDVYNPKVVQATMGSIFRITMHYKNLVDVLHNLEDDIPIIGTMLNGNNIYKADLNENGVVIIGNESHGISGNLLPFIKSKIAIPGFEESNPSISAESLNASVATAIVLAEFRRRFPHEE